MATWTRRHPSATPTTGSTANALTYASAAFTPVAGELLVICTDTTGSLATAPTLTSSANGILFQRLATQQTNASIVGRKIVWIADRLVPASPVSMTVTLTFTSGDPGTGANIFVLALAGMTKTGLASVRQFIGPDNNLAGGAPPAETLPAAPLTANPLLGFIGNVTGSATAITPPTGWTDLGRMSYSTPTKGSYVHTRNSGATAAAITWGSNSTAGGLQIVEFDTSAASSAPGAGSGSGTLTLTGAGVGSAPAVPPKSGSGSGSFAFAGSGTGRRAPKASGSGSVGFAGTGLGKRSPKAGGSGVVSITSSGTSTTVRRGSGSGTLALVGTGTGKRAPKSTGSGTVALTGSGLGDSPAVGMRDGSGSGAWTFTGSGVGKRSPKSGGGGSLALVGAGVGTSPRRGAGGGSLTIVGSGTALRASVASGIGELMWIGAGLGTSQTAIRYRLTATAAPVTHYAAAVAAPFTVATIGTTHTAAAVAPSHIARSAP